MMIATTRAWLLKQKDGQGGFTRKRRALHTWIEDKDCSNAYICWALLETGSSASDLALIEPLTFTAPGCMLAIFPTIWFPELIEPSTANNIFSPFENTGWETTICTLFAPGAPPLAILPMVTPPGPTMVTLPFVPAEVPALMLGLLDEVCKFIVPLPATDPEYAARVMSPPLLLPDVEEEVIMRLVLNQLTAGCLRLLYRNQFCRSHLSPAWNVDLSPPTSIVTEVPCVLTPGSITMDAADDVRSSSTVSVLCIVLILSVFAKLGVLLNEGTSDQADCAALSPCSGSDVRLKPKWSAIGDVWFSPAFKLGWKVIPWAMAGAKWLTPG
jgi:hypothetical protein